MTEGSLRSLHSMASYLCRGTVAKKYVECDEHSVDCDIWRKTYLASLGRGERI